MSVSGWKLKDMMDELVAAEEGVTAVAQTMDADLDELSVYRWRPRGIPELPAIYNWIDDGPLEILDTASVREQFTILCRVAIAHGDDQEQGSQLELYTDAFRQVMDAALLHNQPFNGKVRSAKRLGFRTVIDDHNDIDLLCIELPLQVEFVRVVNP